MRIARVAALAAAFAVLLAPVSTPAASLFQQQRAQKGVDIILNNFNVLGSNGSPFRFAATHSIEWLAPLTVAVTQGAIPVQATVIADPFGNSLILNQTAVTIPTTAGTQTTVVCAFTVAVTTSQTTWTLDSGLSADFAQNLPGTTLKWSVYPQAGPVPSPQSFTAYVVYPNNNNSWQIAKNAGGTATYCVDLQITVPTSVLTGTFSSTAIYSLFW